MKKAVPERRFLIRRIILESDGFPHVEMFHADLCLADRWPDFPWKEQISDPQLKIGRPRQLVFGETPRDYVISKSLNFQCGLYVKAPPQRRAFVRFESRSQGAGSAKAEIFQLSPPSQREIKAPFCSSLLFDRLSHISKPSTRNMTVLYRVFEPRIMGERHDQVSRSPQVPKRK